MQAKRESTQQRLRQIPEAQYKNPKKPPIHRNITELVRCYRGKRVKGRICCGDALVFLRSMKSETAGIVFLDPPFNLRKVYCLNNRKLDCRPEGEYQQWLTNMLQESTRVLMPGGALYPTTCPPGPFDLALT